RGNGYYFLARPRRFVKSLFLSTLRYFKTCNLKPATIRYER
ncbi:MAG: AAA family ATPase, partial [Muribaculaceae bacterium]|nr:AAA family ATPase [Muribaculaceae bacterium]